MKKSYLVITILSILLIISIAILVYGYFQGVKIKVAIEQLQSRNNQLEQDRTQISTDKEQVMTQLEQCRIQSQTDHTKLNMITEDWSKMQKSCVTNNACNGKFPFMRYICNTQGDAVDNGDKICQCDQNCALQITSK